MELKSIKSWQWAVIGAVAGLALGWVKVSMPERGVPRSMTQDEFEMLVEGHGLEHANPNLMDVEIRPGWDGEIVTGRRLYNFQGQSLYEPFVFEAPAPFQPRRGTRQGAAGRTVLAYLAQAGKDDSTLDYRYAWWKGPRETLVISTLGGMLLMGIVWPIGLRLMVSGRLGKDQERPLMDISRFGKQTPVAAAKVLPAQMNRLDVLLENLQDNAKSKDEGPMAAVPKSTAEEKPVTKLNSEGDAPPRPEIEADPKNYGGEFYPTEAHGEQEH